jgi:uncharacterized LabA/DUF88 family protein
MNTLRAATLVHQSAFIGRLLKYEPANSHSSYVSCQGLQPARRNAADDAFGRVGVSRVSDGATQKRVLAFLDTPNLFYSLRETAGGDFVPDYHELLEIARSRGSLMVASALVNDGYPESAAVALRQLGYSVARSEGRDCDFRFIAEAIALHRWGDTFLICSGDHRYAELALALRALGKYVIVVAILPCCSQELRSSADEFVRFPSKLRTTPFFNGSAWTLGQEVAR